MALGVLPLVIDSAAPDHAQHLTADINDALNRLSTAASDANTALEAEITALTATVAALTPPGLVLISTATASSSATIDFTTGITSTYDEYLFTGTDIHPDTNATDLWMQVSEDAGVSFKAGGADYKWATFLTADSTGTASAGSVADTKILMIPSNSTTATSSTSFEARLFAPSGTAASKLVQVDGININSGGNFARYLSGGAYVGTANAINAVRFKSSSGNITSGGFRLYGVRKA